MKLPRLLLACALLLTPLLACADFNKAVQAYRARHYAVAYKQFLHLANAGDARAQTVIALMNKYGESVPENPHAAFGWYMKAARQDYPPAMFEVGVMYAEGTGTKADPDAAIHWLKRASKAGFKRAGQKLAELGAVQAQPRPEDRDGGAAPGTWNFRLPNQIRDRRTPMTRRPPDATYHVLLGILDTRAGAGRLWDALVERAPDVFKDVEPIIRLEPGRRSYQVRTGPFDGLAAAIGFCKRLQNQVQTFCQPVTL